MAALHRGACALHQLPSMSFFLRCFLPISPPLSFSLSLSHSLINSSSSLSTSPTSPSTLATSHGLSTPHENILIINAVTLCQLSTCRHVARAIRAGLPVFQPLQLRCLLLLPHARFSLTAHSFDPVASKRARRPESGARLCISCRPCDPPVTHLVCLHRPPAYRPETLHFLPLRITLQPTPWNPRGIYLGLNMKRYVSSPRPPLVHPFQPLRLSIRSISSPK